MADFAHSIPLPSRRRLPATADAAAAVQVTSAPAAQTLPRRLLLALSAMALPGDFIAEGLAAAGTSPTSLTAAPDAVDPDAHLLHLCREHDRLAAEAWAIDEPWMDVRGGAPPAIDRQARALGEAAQRLQRRIIGIPAHTGPGLAAKARIVIRYSNIGFDGELDPDSDDAMAWSVAQDLVRLHGGAA